MELFKLFGTIALNNQEANESIDETTNKASGLSDKLKAGIGTAAKWGTAVVGGAVAIGGAFVALASSTREYRTEMGKLDTAFQVTGHSSDAARETYSALNAVLGDSGQAVEAANHLSKLCNTEAQLASWTDICTGVYATFGASLPIEGLTEAANETAKVGQVTGPLADALNWAGVSEDAFNESLAACTSEQERQALITETLTGLYSEASNQYKETNKDILASNMAQERLASVMAEVGAVVEPIVTKGTNLLAGMIEKVLEFGTKASEYFPLVQGKFQEVWTIAQEVWTVIGQPIFDSIMSVMQMVYGIFSEYWPSIRDFVSSCFTDIGIFWEQNLKPCLNAIGNFIQTYLAPVFEAIFNQRIKGTIQKVFNFIKSMWENTLKPVFVGITDFLTGVFTLNWQQAWEGVKGILTGILNGIITGIETMINGAINAINGLIEGLNELVSIAGKLLGLNFNIPLIPMLKLPRLEEGGILAKGQVGLLEGRGAEAVVPLDQNSAWISAVAKDMNTAIGGAGAMQVLEKILETLQTMDDGMTEKMTDAFASMKFDVNNREFARLVKAVG